ncbi:MAG TPA: DUF202 domain-containing protein [Candidatus Binataceae bacterium]|nr:DUF202 domain-containing protein [Candidatus Binataceae bacterium]
MADSFSTDPRVYFAAERTFLAWIRTGLALMGFGFVVARFGLFLREFALNVPGASAKSSSFSIWAGVALLSLGVAIHIVSAIRHVMLVSALNRGASVIGRPSYTAIVVASMLAAIGIAMAVYLILVR